MTTLASEIKVGRVYRGIGQVTAIETIFYEDLDRTCHEYWVYTGQDSTDPDYIFSGDEETGWEPYAVVGWVPADIVNEARPNPEPGLVPVFFG